MDLVDRIWTLMGNKNDMTYYELSKRTGIPTNTIRDYLNRKTKNITIDNIVLVADVFRMTVSELLGQVGEKEKYPDRIKHLADISMRLEPSQIEVLIATANAFLSTHRGIAESSKKGA